MDPLGLIKQRRPQPGLVQSSRGGGISPFGSGLANAGAVARSAQANPQRYGYGAQAGMPMSGVTNRGYINQGGGAQPLGGAQPPAPPGQFGVMNIGPGHTMNTQGPNIAPPTYGGGPNIAPPAFPPQPGPNLLGAPQLGGGGVLGAAKRRLI